MERDDTAERLESEKWMNQKMMQALKDGSESGDEKASWKQMQEYEKQLREQKINLETEISSLNSKLTLKDH